MKIKIVFLGILVIFALACENKLTAEKIIKKSIEEAHGGIENWEKINIVRYKKTTILYDSLGNVESCKTQHIQTVLKPNFSSEIFSNEGTIRKHIVLQGEKLMLFINDEPQIDAEKREKAYKEVIAAHFILWQPYKLLTDDVSLTLQGKIHLEDGSEVYKIKAVYPESNTQWWYYFDVNTWLLRENLVKHGATYSQIKNLEQEDQTGFRLHQKRKSYTIDSIRNQKYLRASYHYEIYELR